MMHGQNQNSTSTGTLRQALVFRPPTVVVALTSGLPKLTLVGSQTFCFMLDLFLNLTSSLANPIVCLKLQPLLESVQVKK